MVASSWMPYRHTVVNSTNEIQEAARAIFAEKAGNIQDPAYVDLLIDLAARIDREGFCYVSFSGAQGSGKSTLARLLSELLQQAFDKSVVLLSLDDYYLTRDERQKLSEEVHPLFTVRGVPRTHDIDRLAEAIESLRNSRPVTVPVFDKSTDDRSGEVVVEPADIIIGEGWCWGARPQPAVELAEPVNDLESTEDPYGIWRRHVNDALAGRYQEVFSADLHIYLKVPSLDAVVKWRWEQEQELKERTGQQLFADVEDVRGFVAYYERLTRWMLSDVAERADVVVDLDEEHGISDIRFR